MPLPTAFASLSLTKPLSLGIQDLHLLCAIALLDRAISIIPSDRLWLSHGCGRLLLFSLVWLFQRSAYRDYYVSGHSPQAATFRS